MLAARSKLLVACAFSFAAATACGASDDLEGAGADEDGGVLPEPPRDAATPTPPAFEGGLAPEDAGVGPAPDGGNDLSGCPDPGDPGGPEPTAKQLPDTDDCDSSRGSVQGITRGIADVDMYRATFTDKSTCRVDPELELDGAGLEFCVFVQCKVNGAGTDVKSCGGGVKKDSAIGLHGCCAGSPAQMNIDWNCTGTIDEQSDIYFRVTPTANVCQRYTLRYKF